MWRWFWTGSRTKSVNDHRKWHLFYRQTDGRFWSWNEGGRFLSASKLCRGLLRIYLFGLVVYFDTNRNFSGGPVK